MKTEVQGVFLNLSPEEFQVMLNESHELTLKTYLKKTENQSRFADLPKYLTRKDVAELFGVTLNTVTNWVKKGQLKSIKFNRAVRFEKDVIVDLILSGSLKKFETGL